MALVNCTRQIYDHVIKKIDEMFKERLEHAYKLCGMTDGEIAKEIYDRIHTPERLQFIREIEKDVSGDFRMLYDCSEIHIGIKLEGGVERTLNVKWNGNAKPTLLQFSNQYNAPVIRHLSPEATTAIKEAKERYKAVKQDQESFRGAFKEAYNKVKSINELVKLWPAVVELLPEGTMERIERKNGPRSKQGPAFDAAALNVQLLKAKVAK